MRVKKYIYVGFGWAKNWFPFFLLQGVGNYDSMFLHDRILYFTHKGYLL